MSIYNLMSALTGESAPNRDPKTGIHYGVIGQHQVSPHFLDEIISSGTNLTFEAAKEQYKADLQNAVDSGLEAAQTFLRSEAYHPENLEDLVGELFEHNPDSSEYERALEDLMDQAVDDFGYEWDCGGGETYEYEEGGLVVNYDTNDGEIMVFKSPFFTETRECSPCFPNAGNLEDHEDGYLKTYCLGHTEFEDERAPYPVYSVETGKIVYGPPKYEYITPTFLKVNYHEGGGALFFGAWADVAQQRCLSSTWGEFK